MGKLSVTLAVTCLLSAVRLSGAEDRVTFVQIGTHAIDLSEVELYMRLAPDDAKTSADDQVLTPPEYEKLQARRKRRALQELIDRHLLLMEAKAQYMGMEGVSERLDELANQELRAFEDKVGSKLEARMLFARLGITVEQYMELQRDTALIGSLLAQEAYVGIRVKPVEIRDFYERNLDDFRVEKTVVYRQIFLPVLDPDEDRDVEARAKDILRSIQSGVDFAEAVEQHSADAETYPGGLHTVTVPEGMPDWLPPAVEGLKPGQISSVRRSTAGYTIVQLVSITAAGVVDFQAVQGEIRQTLLEEKRREARADYVERLGAKADIQYLEPARQMGFPLTPDEP
jgi:parvulin-like peptidyl-prolyl isomerase